MKFSKGFAARIAVATVGGLVLIGTAGAASAAEQIGADDVDVNVDIADTGAGSLSLTVAGTTATLEESASGVADVRQFDGTLPTVTVTDTRDVADIPADTWWYVTGQASDFMGPGGATITADHFGWTPNLIDDGDTGLIAEGDEVGTSLDSGPNAVGLVGQELLYASLESATVRESGETSWTADAALVLKTDADVAPGTYSSKLTLSLFEDVF